MTARILDGKALAATIREEIRDEVSRFVEQRGVQPCLAAVLVGEDPASQVYVRNKQRACERAGIASQLHRLAETCGEDELLQLVADMNADPAVHGMLVQLPLPAQIRAEKVLVAVDPAKDVDAFHPENVGRLVQGRPRFLPCTPHGVQQLLVRESIEIAGAHVVIVGRSDIVGKPLANMLVQRGAGGDATVTLCHSRTRELADVTRSADILIAAIGRARFITADMIKPGATVIDVGINRTDDGLVGDVDFEAALAVAGAITPVPGGVGPLTIAMLLHNTLAAAGALI
ncbi:MAG: bifunctional methylenetetrahydrofolate dehydrogenase/methenyltetrahydrofolate cyclohydrolase FolD [Planctomycetota bacterium]|nr:MAG: bifunctional methylenetetrahydrofolate dehydrogenase/methenyltetrahydrofolate cyclohydrolase FolD [Planctomycetota bacterium]REK45858.1 MAG: bifunctional methylenetetrahydrofolate dehydrogenase/methenyltetrahydrofolate cyclohydrolase FolD [Planctomycetota bacterium]